MQLEIKEFPLYKIDEKGIVYSYSKYKKGDPIKQYIDKDGYVKVSLNKDKKSYNLSVHRLVANTFIENPKNKETVNHIDGNKLNNTVENLEWNTVAENNEHAIRTGLNNPFFMRNGIITQYDLDGVVVAKFNSYKEAEEKTGINKDNISRACRGLISSAGKYLWTNQKSSTTISKESRTEESEAVSSLKKDDDIV